MKIAPLSSGFFLTSIVGFFISVFAVYPWSPTWGFTFMLMFIFMFVASMVSMTYSNVDDYLMQETHERHDDELRKARGIRRDTK